MDKILNELVGRLKTAAGGNLKAAVLYGSAVTGEFQEKHSDLNVLCLVERAGGAELEQLNPAATWWMKKGHPAPLVFTLDELRRSADVFAIELLDMKTHHRMLFGEDFLTGLEVPMTLHALQVERELRASWLRLRQGILGTPGKREAMAGLMIASASTFATLFRHVLIALGERPPDGRRAVADRIAAVVGGDATAFQTVLDIRGGKQKAGDVDVAATLRRYLEFVERVTDEVDRQLEARK